MTKTYFFPDTEHYDAFFGASAPICIDRAELERLARGWEMDIEDLMEQVHEATENEIAEYGTYNAE